MRLAVFLTCLLLATGCGASAADLFLVERSGADRNANLTLLVSDDGQVTCNGRKHMLDGEQLLEARELARNLSQQAELNLALPPGPKPVLSYRVRLEAGTVAFADTSRPLPRSFSELTAFTSTIANDVCGISRPG
jgi:hypothetical protein